MNLIHYMHVQYIIFKQLFDTDPPPVYNITTSSSTTPADLTDFDVIISWTVSTHNYVHT